MCSFASSELNCDFFARIVALPVFENPSPFVVDAAFGDNLFAFGFYSDAGDEYDRAAKLMPFDPAYDYASYQRAVCFIRLRDYVNAAHVLDRLAYTALDKEVSYQARLLRALLETARDNPERGEFLLSEILRDVPEKSDEVQYWRGWCKLLSYNIDGALDDFALVCNSVARNPYYSPRAYGIRRWLEINRHMVDSRSPYLARWFSGILPGTGQMYLGNWRAGTDALAINALWGYLTLDALLARRFLQSSVIFLFGWNRYYFGGMMNAERATVDFNDSQWDEALEVLLDNYIGPDAHLCVHQPVSDRLPQAAWLNSLSLTGDLLLSLYQGYITGQDAQQCQFGMGCSKFARIAFRMRNPLTAILMTSDRLLRCNPFARTYYPADSLGYLCDEKWHP